MKIERMNKGEWGKVRAFFDLATQEGFIIKGFKIIEGINGLFVSMPSQKSNDGEFYDSVFASRDLRDELNDIALGAYKGESFNAPKAQETTTVESQESTENPNDDKITKEGDAVQPFSEDDIPF
tara:strand:- start:3788 stop:4159 length:372 start_codon:yes stop_codon:yes gene_type:complete